MNNTNFRSGLSKSLHNKLECYIYNFLNQPFYVWTLPCCHSREFAAIGIDLPLHQQIH